jgi:glycosyltransferase involved in cell wall biosynthesis
MKILLSSHFFHPSVGGIEQVSFTLAREFVKAGHEVRVVTTTSGEGESGFSFETFRRPAPGKLIDLVRWCDVFFHNNISLQTAWPLLFIRKPWVVAHHTWLARISGRIGLRDRLKQHLIRYAVNISVSKAVARHLSTPSVTIGNPYRDELFKVIPGVRRDRELVFLGRLVWDKGLDLLISALALLRQKGVTPRLTVIGDGSEGVALRNQIQRMGLETQIEMVGTRTGAELVSLLNAHNVIVIPSRWQEPFGLVALEGIACGCVAVGAECGGLPDAIGPAGTTFACDDVEDMARKIEALLDDEAVLKSCRAAAAGHLLDHTAKDVARKYLDVLEGASRWLL